MILLPPDVSRRGRIGSRWTLHETQKKVQAQLRRVGGNSAFALALIAVLLLAWNNFSSLMDKPGSDPWSQAAAARGSDDKPLVDAVRPLGTLAEQTYGTIPRMVIACLVLGAAALLARSARTILRQVLRGRPRAEATSAAVSAGIWIVAIGGALSVMMGDARAIIASLAVFGLALVWALQTPIESFIGWLVNSARGYYRIGDRVAVGDVVGDVYAIDTLTTTVWEIGGSSGTGVTAQPTGALVTFPNSEVLRSSIVNYTRDCPYVWDELTVRIGEESDVAEAIRTVTQSAQQVLGEMMAAPASEYQATLRSHGLGYDIAAAPQVFATVGEGFTDLTVRYLVGVRDRRTWSSKLAAALASAVGPADERERALARSTQPVVELIGAAARG